MFYFELLRNLKSRLVRIALIVAAVYYVFLTVFQFVHTNISEIRETDAAINSYLAALDVSDPDKVLEQLNEELDGLSAIVYDPQNSEKITTEAGKYGKTILSDLSIVSHTAERAAYLLKEYPESTIKTILNRMEALKKTEALDDYIIREQQKAVAQYNRVRDFNLLSSRGISIWYDISNGYFFFYVLLLFVVIVIGADCFTSEHACDMSKMTSSTRNGRGRLFFAKLAAMAVSVTGLVLVITVFDIIEAICIAGTDILAQPIQTLQIYRGCPLYISVLGFLLLRRALTLLLLFTVIGLCALVCAVLRNGFAAMLTAAVPVIISVFVWFSVSNYAVNDTVDNELYMRYKSLCIWNPICLLETESYFTHFDCLNILGIPISRIGVCVIVSAFFLAFTVSFAALRYGRPTRARR